MKLKTIDLCAGIGGIRRGFELAGGYRNIASAEIDEMACKTYEHLFHEDPRNDVTNEKFKKHLQTLHYDVLMAGFPCQAFSSVGLQHGFEDKTKGTIFFDIAKIIKMTRPKVVFLENVQNLLSHDKQATFKTIVDTLDRQLDYHIVGVTHDKDGIPQYKRSAFLRNSRDFGVPQNRPRVYIVAFSRAYFGQHISLLPEEAPTKRSRTPVFKSLADVLDKKVDSRFFLSSGYLDTLEKHIVTQHKKGYGFGYCIVNAPEIETPIANTLLATGGSGRERNLIYDPINGASCAGTSIKGKYSPINDKFIRTMTPNEWGRLQGFVGYAFVDKNGIDQFSFPEGIRNVQRFKQFGNSVTIPVIEEYALFIQQCCDTMYDAFSPIEKRLFSMYGNEFLLCSLISRELAYHLRKDTLNRYFSIVYHYKLNCFRTKELARYLDVSAARASQIITQLTQIGCVHQESNGTRCLFQPTVKIKSDVNGFRFCEYSSLVDFNLLDAEEQSLELQYRNKRVYGTGLGTSVNWNIDADGNGEIYNDFFPETEVPSMDFSIPQGLGIHKEALSMRHLSDLDQTEKSQKLSELKSVADAYSGWIDTLKEKQQELSACYKAAAESNIAGCLKARNRMLAGLKVLNDDSVAWTAFSLANRAMFMQRVHLKLQSDTADIDRYPGDEDLTKLLETLDYGEPRSITGDNYAWRLFQIAFLLMSIESVTNDTACDRDVVDLIWFPTGGGKTEAYLGLTAFTIFYRRLAHLPDSDGTTVIMRYTLRLLAAQQFTRASTLICACEYIRSDAVSRHPKYGKYPLGNTEITIGLWIGREHIPNTNADAKKHLKELTDARTDTLQYAKEQHNKFQVLKCPWCGTKLVKDRIGTKMVGTFGYRMRNNRHFELFCPQESCFFNQQGKLPIQIVDEELYACPPTLLFGTVDKFAMIPWKKEIGTFFAAGTGNRAPDLVIQDELHLISGPLGTMVGLYETAIDALCTRNGIRPKIVASTATIRRAKEQCSALYNREVSQFPHPGLDAEDSFFARESIINYDHKIYGRKYVGLMPSGKTKAMMEVRSIAALMQEINTMDLPDDIKDKFWTLTVYFNSLKDLGKCSTLVDDDVKDFIKRTAYRLGSAKDARMIARADELTSRVNTTQLNETLDKLEKLCYSKENIENKRYPSNILLATNMISVGIDVARLNVMLLVGQPKLTSEYIQASSRVGRSFPGVAFALYDGSKSRDRSHYEQ